jgi:hypothetical protein
MSNAISTRRLILKGAAMDKSTQDKSFTDDQIVTARGSRRRLFLKLLGGGVLGATAVATGIGRVERTEANDFEPLWDSAQVLIGNSPADQSPSPFIECPMFFVNGHFANASHTLDLSDLQTTGEVRGTVTFQNDTIEPDFGSGSVAAALAQGTDGTQYLVVAGEGKVTGGTGYFSGVTDAIIRCKYKAAVGQTGNLLLIACVDCVIILVRN